MEVLIDLKEDERNDQLTDKQKKLIEKNQGKFTGF